MASFKLRGISNVINNLNGAVREVEKKAVVGLTNAAIEIRRSMDKEAPKIPVDTGVLRASWFMRRDEGDNNEIKIQMGFSANYAFQVHEMMGAGTNWKRPESGPRFFLVALERAKERGTVLKELRKEVHLDGRGDFGGVGDGI